MQADPGIYLKRTPARLKRWILTGLWTLLALVVAGSWLLVVYLMNGQGVLNEVKLGVQSGRAGQMQTVNAVLSRAGSLGTHVEALAVYATSEFFELANRQFRDIAYDPATAWIFIVNEDTHMDELPLIPTPVQLRVDGGLPLAPATLEMVTYSIHHKITIATFSKPANASPNTLELILPTVDHSGTAYQEGQTVSMNWDLPIVYPEGALAAEALPLSTMVAVAMGLLATVLTPCLIQLLVFYLSTLTGMSAQPIEGALDPALRRRLLTVALGFVIGYTALFTGAGALAGYAGQTLQNAWSEWTRPLAIGSGVVIILMGLWMAARARAPLVCGLPGLRGRANRPDTEKTSFLRASLMGVTFAVGCSTCFGGALIATLLLYVGTLGSAWEGALILFFFSLGVGIPFLISAALLTRVLPLMQRVQRVAPAIGLVSGAVMVVFGVLLLTDNFHKVSAWIYPLLGLS